MTNKKTHPQRTRRAELEAKWQKIKPVIRERDRDRCVLCGQPATSVHHVFNRGHVELFLNIKFLACLCEKDHGDDANTKRTIARILNVLQREYEYDYPEWCDYYLDM